MTVLAETLATLFGPSAATVSIPKRDAILDAAIAVFAEFGYHAADVQEVARRADVGKGTVYRYFISKDHLFWAATVWGGERLYQLSLPVVEGNDPPRTKLRRLAEIRAAFFTDHADMLELFAWQRAMFRGKIPPDIEVYARRHSFDLFARIVKEGIASGDFHCDNNPDLLAFSILSAVHGATMNHCFVREHITLLEHINSVLEPMLQT
ncbi:MAG: TetR/AcrR family transcriptional regulator [Thermoguttaceae bacterium]